MSELPPRHPADSEGAPDEGQVQRQQGTEFESQLEAVGRERYEAMKAEMSRHGYNIRNLNTQHIYEWLSAIYKQHETEAALAMLDVILHDDPTNQEAQQLRQVLAQLFIDDKEIVEIVFDSNYQRALRIQQVVDEAGTEQAHLRTVVYYLKEGKIHVISLQAPADELKLSDHEHEELIQKQMNAVSKDEVALGMNDFPLNSNDGKHFLWLSGQLSQAVNGFYTGAIENKGDLAHWPERPSMN